MDRRQCLIDGNVTGFFHGFTPVETAYFKVGLLTNDEHLQRLEKMFNERHIVPCGCDLEKVAHVGAIIEHLNGSIEIISPVERIRFVGPYVKER